MLPARLVQEPLKIPSAIYRASTRQPWWWRFFGVYDGLALPATWPAYVRALNPRLDVSQDARIAWKVCRLKVKETGAKVLQVVGPVIVTQVDDQRE